VGMGSEGVRKQGSTRRTESRSTVDAVSDSEQSFTPACAANKHTHKHTHTHTDPALEGRPRQPPAPTAVRAPAAPIGSRSRATGPSPRGRPEAAAVAPQSVRARVGGCARTPVCACFSVTAVEWVDRVRRGWGRGRGGRGGGGHLRCVKQTRVARDGLHRTHLPRRLARAAGYDDSNRYYRSRRKLAALHGCAHLCSAFEVASTGLRTSAASIHDACACVRGAGAGRAWARM
jgi:hypothetical protein